MTDATEVTQRKKLTPKSVMGKIPNPPEKGTTPLYTIIGVCHGVVKGAKEFGGETRPWTKLIGNFEAVNLISGEVFAAPECFLPEPYNSMIAQKFEGDSAVNAVEFAIEVGLSPPAEGQTVKYVYAGKMIQEAGEADPLANLRKRVPQLAGPSAPALPPGKKK